MGNQKFSGFFQQGHRLIPADRREILQKLINGVAAFQVIKQRPDGNARAGKAWLATHYFWVNQHNRRFPHALN